MARSARLGIKVHVCMSVSDLNAVRGSWVGCVRGAGGVRRAGSSAASDVFE